MLGIFMFQLRMLLCRLALFCIFLLRSCFYGERGVNTPILFHGSLLILSKVRKPTDFGFVFDSMGNMPAMEVDATRIRGTAATVKIRYAFGKKVTPDQLLVKYIFFLQAERLLLVIFWIFDSSEEGQTHAEPFVLSSLHMGDCICDICSITGGDMDYAPWEAKQMGSEGRGAGAAYVFSRSAAAEGFVWGQDQVHREVILN